MSTTDLHLPASIRNIVAHRFFTFILVGAAGTAMQLGLYLIVRQFAVAQVATAVSLVLSTIFSTAAHRSLTFHATETTSVASSQAQGFALLALNWIAQAVVVAALGTLGSALVEAVATTITGMAVGGVRYLVMSRWAPATAVAA